MRIEKYPFKADKYFLAFEFVSVGPKGNIVKLIQFTETNLKGMYNLAFGDKDLQTGEMNDKINSNNRDSEKVLATIVFAVYVFTDTYKDCWIYSKGSTRSRNRLYRMGITKYLNNYSDFEVFGSKGNNWYLFEENGDYEEFLIKRK